MAQQESLQSMLESAELKWREAREKPESHTPQRIVEAWRELALMTDREFDSDMLKELKGALENSLIVPSYQNDPVTRDKVAEKNIAFRDAALDAVRVAINHVTDKDGMRRMDHQAQIEAQPALYDGYQEALDDDKSIKDDIAAYIEEKKETQPMLTALQMIFNKGGLMKQAREFALKEAGDYAQGDSLKARRQVLREKVIPGILLK